jgi:hypothetical protein
MNNQSIHLSAMHKLDASFATAKKLCFVATLVFQETKDQQP